MGLTSVSFLLCLAALLIVYYLTPRRAQWLVLLAASIFFYLWADLRAGLFLLASILITWFCACRMERIRAAETDENRARARCKRVLLAGMLANFSILAVLKYLNFLLQNFAALTGASLPALRLLLPLGISYYTFQTVGYLLDVYWKRTQAQTNVLRLALFVSFFPQLVQGPIGRYDRLAPQLTEGHALDWDNLRRGMWRIAWGLFLKMVLADWAGVFREAIFASPEQYGGIAIFGTLLYTVELYGNFAGGIDLAIGISLLFSVRLDENFRRPFFSGSLTEFWQRWHITLGTWMKDYVFIPLSMSRAMRAFGKKSKARFGKKIGRVLPLCLSNLIVFFLVGLWHGPTWANIGWGLYNGVIIASTNLLGDFYGRAKTRLGIRSESRGWRLFMILRTFALINLSWYFDCTSSAREALRIIRLSLTRFSPAQFLSIPAGGAGLRYTPWALLTLAVGVLIVFLVELLQEKGRLKREPERMHWLVQTALILALIVSVPLLGPTSAARGFIYAQF